MPSFLCAACHYDITTSVFMLNDFMLSILAEFRYDVCRCAVRLYAECCYAQCYYDECRYNEFHYAEWVSRVLFCNVIMQCHSHEFCYAE